MTRIDRILTSDKSDVVKALKLQNLALRCMPASPMQDEVIAAYNAFMAEKGLLQYDLVPEKFR